MVSPEQQRMAMLKDRDRGPFYGVEGAIVDGRYAS
jgi:hypothetical protein